MGKRKREIIFGVCLVVIILIGAYFMYIKKEDETNVEENNMTLSADEMESLDEEQIDEQEQLLAERASYYNECMDISKKTPEYHYGKYDINYNKEFVKEQCAFRSTYDMVEYEFIGYEEVDNLTEYMKDINWDAADVDLEFLKYGLDVDLDKEYIDNGFINRDGTFNTLTRRMWKVDENRNLGEEMVNENVELMAVKVKVRYKNLSAKENIVNFENLHTLSCLIYMEDDELYAISSAYVRDLLFETRLPIYTSMADRYPREEDAVWGTKVRVTEIMLEPYEEYVGELIYIFAKDEYENMAFMSNYAANGDNLNYKDIGTNIVFFSYLKEILGE